MAYLLRRKEPVDTEVQRVLREQVGRAASLLETWRDNPRDNVHQARQAFKRVRALLRLVRPGARYVFRVENQIFRGLGSTRAAEVHTGSSGPFPAEIPASAAQALHAS